MPDCKSRGDSFPSDNMEAQPTLAWSLIVAVVVGFVCLLTLLTLVALVVWLMVRRKPQPVSIKKIDRTIDVSALNLSALANGAPQLEYYGCQVRLAILVLAPVGRDGSIPEEAQLPELLQQFVPNFLQVVVSHQPELHFWPAQVSQAGFSNAFFGRIPLPGNQGKGTPWCGIAGRFTALDQPYLAGIICHGENATGLGQLVIEHEGKWRDVLRVKT